MKIIDIGFAALVTCGSFLPLHAQWQHTVPITDETAAGRLTISGINGDLVVEGTDASEVQISSPDLETPEQPEKAPAEGMRSLLATGADNSGRGLQIDSDGSNVKVSAVRPHESAEFTFRIPRTMSLQIQGVMEGDVTVTGVHGEMEIVVTEGDVQVQGAAAPIVINAVNGDVRVTYDAFPDSRPASINAVNGSVVVELPLDVKVDLDLRTVNGDIFTDLPVEVKDRRIVSWGGPKSVSGVLNGGGGKLSINAINDDVTVRGPKE